MLELKKEVGSHILFSKKVIIFVRVTRREHFESFYLESWHFLSVLGAFFVDSVLLSVAIYFGFRLLLSSSSGGPDPWMEFP